MTKLIAVIVLGVYLLGIWKFMSGYNRTNFSRQLPTKLMLALLWPVLLTVNTSYRQNFTKALKGKDY
ncbi:conserved hypothetical protein [Crocosphaera subtropica ATCC 51142]|uniref:Uncharacterized protein n=1 Tax=Crocosphaera subtropica (strain ATCC 51142 / BH68) TaxID=43989 RepID=B1WXZ7_CROS5|nr:hypothetical protein [Crocosphaera subtropica]ACB50984.1 conserved hypothetical protein [Crocosphaera subtropica ATCC 51142]